jgi:hypothetical protein
MHLLSAASEGRFRDAAQARVRGGRTAHNVRYVNSGWRCHRPVRCGQNLSGFLAPGFFRVDSDALRRAVAKRIPPRNKASVVGSETELREPDSRILSGMP